MDERIHIFAGHFGSGKTNLSVNYALGLRGRCGRVILIDLDIVNPYFRSADFTEHLRRNGVEVIASGLVGGSVELPSIPRAARGALLDESAAVVLDVGGDDRGALALGRYASEISTLPYEMCFVVNMYRPLTATPQAALSFLREVESAARVRATALVNNPNIGAATTAEDVLASRGYIEQLSVLSGLPVKMTAVTRDLYEDVTGHFKSGELFPIDIYIKEQYDFRDTSE